MWPNFRRDEESYRLHFSRNHSDDFPQYWNKQQSTSHRGYHFRGHRNHHPNYNNNQRNYQDFQGFSLRHFNRQQNGGGQLFRQRNQGNTNFNRPNNDGIIDHERGISYRPKFQEYLKFRRCRSSLDLRDLDETKHFQSNLNRSMCSNRNSVDREILRNSNSRDIFSREIVSNARPDHHFSRRSCEKKFSKPFKNNEEGTHSKSLAVDRRRDNKIQQNLNDLVIKITGKKENINKESLSNIQKMTFSSDSSENGDEQPTRKIFLKELASNEENKEDQDHLPQSEFAEEQSARKRKLPDSFEWGDDSDEEFDEKDGSGIKFLYTADKLPKYDGKTPIGQEGGLVLQVHCCTYCRVVYKSSKLLQHHFLTKSHYNKYKALLNDTEVLQMFKKC